jgi:hypothetical protein
VAIRGARRRRGRHTLARAIRGSAVAGIPSVRNPDLDAAISLACLIRALLLGKKRRGDHRQKKSHGAQRVFHVPDSWTVFRRDVIFAQLKHSTTAADLKRKRRRPLSPLRATVLSATLV